MIVKVIPIKSGRNAVKNAVNYVADKEKIAGDLEENTELEVDNIVKAGLYISDSDKIKGQYLSSYNCSIDFASEEFLETKKNNYKDVGKEYIEEEGEIIAYHVIQSFPRDCNLSDSQIHQCGIDLMKKIGLYQGVIASHLEPGVDENGKKTGTQKHNHIIFNSHTLDPIVQNGSKNRMKYYFNKESFNELKKMNDEIAIENGLDIVESKKNRGKNMVEIKKDDSWKQKIREDIDIVKNNSKDFAEFKVNLEKKGVKIREGKYLTYINKEENKVRCRTLGEGYTKEEIEKFLNNNKNKNKDKKLDFLTKDNTKKTRLYTDYGRKRSNMELLLILAIKKIDRLKDNIIKTDIKDIENIELKVDYKAQALEDCLKITKDYNIRDINNLESKINNIGINMAITNKELKNRGIKANKIKAVEIAIDNYNDNPTKENEERLKKYESKKGSSLLTEEGQKDFFERASNNKEEIYKLEEKLEGLKQDYKKLKKVEYNVNKIEADKQIDSKKENIKTDKTL